MSINQGRYVDITSGVGAADNIPARNLGALVITNNTLCPTGTKLDFTSAEDVGDYFGTSSEEYNRALFYFGWISKNITQPQILSFYFWNNNANTPDYIFGSSTIDTLAQFNALTAGQLEITMGGVTDTLTVNLSTAANLTSVASITQAAIRSFSTGGATWTNASVTYNPSTTSFNLTGGASGTDTIAVTQAASNDLAGPLGWLTGAVLSNGSAAQNVTAMLNQLVEVDNDFGSFCFRGAFNMTQGQITAAAEWNNSLTPNNQYLYSVGVTAGNASAASAALLDIGGVTATLIPTVADTTGAYHEMMPMMIAAATDYTQPNSVQNYMYQQFNATPTVTTDANANLYDGLRINYYGQTQVNGQLIQFYQRGVMFGLPVDPSDQNVYVNEIWFKSAIGAALMELLLALPQVPANNAGRLMIQSQIQSVISVALLNGTIEVGKELTNTQQLYITQVTGSPTAWQQVQNAGYWLGVVIQSYVTNGVTQYQAVYTLVYSKDDTIRLITGSDILI